MWRREAHRGKRAELAWMLGGLVMAQLALGLAVDQFWLAVRDPEFAALRQRLAARRAEAPGRPLVLLLGSSRTSMGVDAEKLGQTAAGNGLLAFNFGIPASGPMMQQVVLRRLLDQGVRPDLASVEVMPMSLGRSGGYPLEEHQLDAARLDAAEAARLLRYYQHPNHILRQWAYARILPAYRHQAELRKTLQLDGAWGDATPWGTGYGWHPERAVTDPQERAAAIRSNLEVYEDPLNDMEPAQGPLTALRDLLALCHRSAISVVLVMPPESAVFRSRSEAAFPRIDEKVRRLAREFDASVYDARAWVPDDDFRDAIHPDINGAEKYTARFGREVLRPELDRVAARGR